MIVPKGPALKEYALEGAGRGGGEGTDGLRRHRAVRQVLEATGGAKLGPRERAESGARAGRRYRSGPLGGRWALVALTRDCVATYGEREARAAAWENEEIVIPLPAGVSVVRVEAMGHDGGTFPHRWSPDPRGVLVVVPDAAGPVAYVRVVWR